MYVKYSRIKSQKKKKNHSIILFLFVSILRRNQKSMFSYLRKKKKKKKNRKNIPQHNSNRGCSKHKRYTAKVIAAKFAKLDKLRESYVRLLQGLQKCLMATNLRAYMCICPFQIRICYARASIHALEIFNPCIAIELCIAFYYHSYSLLSYFDRSIDR